MSKDPFEEAVKRGVAKDAIEHHKKKADEAHKRMTKRVKDELRKTDPSRKKED